MHPVARDDEGKIVQTQQPEGPPPLFPEIPKSQFPPLPQDIPTQTERQLIWRHQLVHAWRHSLYFLKAGTDGGSGANKRHKADFVESYKDQEKAAAAAGAAGSGAVDPTAACTVTMTLHPQYFPEELYSKQKRLAKGAAEKAYWAGQNQRRAKAKAATEDLALGKLDELARREDKASGAGKGPGGGGGEEGEEALVEEFEEEEDELPDDDDYNQGNMFDDDDGYGDDLDDGGGDQAIF